MKHKEAEVCRDMLEIYFKGLYHVYVTVQNNEAGTPLMGLDRYSVSAHPASLSDYSSSDSLHLRTLEDVLDVIDWRPKISHRNTKEAKPAGSRKIKL